MFFKNARFLLFKNLKKIQKIGKYYNHEKILKLSKVDLLYFTRNIIFILY